MVDTTFPECDRFQSAKQRAICRGEDLTPELCDNARIRWGLPPLNPAGPGSEFKALANSLGIANAKGCDCEAIRREMDQLGVDGCRRDRDRLIASIRENAAKVSWLQKAMAVVPALLTGIAFVVDPLDPVPGLFDEAVRLAEEKQKTACKPRTSPAKKKCGCGKKPMSPKIGPPPPIPFVSLPFNGPVTRHLAMHVWPVKNVGAWQWNLDQVIQRAHLFNGRRVIGIATSRDADPPEAVMEYLRARGFDAEFVVKPNSKKKGEVVTFLDMMAILAGGNGRNDATFYCHAKGVRHKFRVDDPNHTVFQWTEAMYQTCLDYWPLVESALTNHAFVGSFRRAGFFRTPGNYRWHYSGTFYWFRNSEIFNRRWHRIDQKYYGTEAWPGLMAPYDQSACLFGDHAGTLYDLNYWHGQIAPALKEWKNEHRNDMSIPH